MKTVLQQFGFSAGLFAAAVSCAAMLSGCQVYMRSVAYNTINRAEMESAIYNAPATGAASVAAEKTTTANAAVTTAEGAANATQPSQPK